MTQEQKDHYKVRAQRKPSRAYHTPPKFTSQGISIENIERERKELVEWEKYMEVTIKNWVTNGQISGGSYPFPTLLFYFQMTTNQTFIFLLCHQILLPSQLSS